MNIRAPVLAGKMEFLHGVYEVGILLLCMQYDEIHQSDVVLLTTMGL